MQMIISNVYFLTKNVLVSICSISNDNIPNSAPICDQLNALPAVLHQWVLIFIKLH